MNENEILEENRIRNKPLDDFTPNLSNEEFSEIKLEGTVSKDEKIINPRYDYSNIIPNKEYVKVLTQYCFAVYNQLLKMFDEDQKKNERLKSEYKNFEYLKHYSTGIEISVKERAKEGQYIGSSYDFNDYKSFIDYIDRKPTLTSLKIELNLSFKRGGEYKTTEYTNVFIISFEPYNIIFSRKSNHEDKNMDQIEQYIKSVLDKFSTVDTIFYSK